MQNRQRQQKLNDIIDGWAATYRIGKAIASNFNLQEVISLIGKIACSFTSSNAASIVAVNGDGRLYIAGSHKVNKDKARKGPLKFEKMLAHQSASGKRVILINDLTRKDKYRCDSLLKDGCFLSAACIPVMFNNRFLASLILYSKSPSYYTKEHMRISLALAHQIALAIQNYQLYSNMHMNYFNTIKSLVLAMEAKDPYTKGHSERVTNYALMIADMLGVSALQTQMIKYCGMLHDLGKIAISDSVLNKKEPLTPQERSLIERHPVEGAEVLAPLVFLRSGIPIVKHHHEKFDGSGYPDGLKGEAIPVGARILACADVYDAMTTDRPYRPRLTQDRALDELRKNAGTQFDPGITNLFLKRLENRQ